MRYDPFSAARFSLDHRVHVHLVEDDQPVPPIAVGVHPFVLVYGCGETGDDERGKGERLPGAHFMFADHPARMGHIHFDQGMDGMLLRCEPTALNRHLPFHGEGQRFILHLIHGHISPLIASTFDISSHTVKQL